MQKFKLALIGLFLFSLTGCANSRLRKDFVGFFKSDWPARKSPFEQKCASAGDAVADSVNRVGCKFDDCPIEQRSGQVLDEADRKKEVVAKNAGESVEKAKEKTGDCFDWAKRKIGAK